MSLAVDVLAGGVAGGTSIMYAALGETAGQAQCRVHLADRTIGADGQQTIAGARFAVADRNARLRVAYVVELAAEQPRCFHQPRFVLEALVQPRGDVEPRFHRGDGIGDQIVAERAAGIGDAEDQGPRTCGGGLREIHPRQIERQAAIVVAELADTDLRTKNGEAA